MCVELLVIIKMKIKKKTKLYEWQQKKYGNCGKCGKERELSVEHIIPQHLLTQLGLRDPIYEDEENFDLYCFSCNRFKGGNLDMAHPKTIPLLKKYINQI
jgi:5-methylcytosine-specific restriction endonuclease McrA